MSAPKLFLLNAAVLVGLILCMIGIKCAVDYLQSSGIVSGDEADNDPFGMKTEKEKPTKKKKRK